MKKVEVLKKFRRGRTMMTPEMGVIELGDVEAAALAAEGLVKIQERPENRKKK